MRHPYRLVVIFGFAVVLILVLAFPCQLRGPDPWAYFYAIHNFAHGRFIVDDATHNQQAREVESQSGRLTQYVQVGKNRWALEKAPGYPLLAVPFYWLGLPHITNVTLALAALAVIYAFLRQLFDERVACFGCLLFLFTPANLVMFHESYMAMFAASALLTIGGGLYFCSLLSERPRLRPWLLLLSGLALGWAAVCRLTNLFVVLVFALHLTLTNGRKLFKGSTPNWRELASFGLGCGLALVVLLAYNSHVFGSPFDHGYNYSPYHPTLAYQYLGREGEREKTWTVVIQNVRSLSLPLTQGFPLLIMALPGLFCAWRRLPRSIYILTTGWLLAVYLPAMQLTWLPRLLRQYPDASLRHLLLDRYFLPGLFPLVVLAVALLHIILKKWGLALAVAYGLVGSWLYLRGLAVR
ncbi:MAG: glycosyltransferase family 39 protein [Anaerolineae bacterium]|jgi:hypothetical protein|nr:glycosyltransferase family 39 protein [Anaerolineae bacterium]MDH7475579.1 glycosyltransferase family 39 protein [Anaerolineae bacterium]